MTTELNNANNIKTAKVRVTRLEETGTETYYFNPDTLMEVKLPRDIEVECSGDEVSFSFVVRPKDLIYQVGDNIEITYRKC